MAVCITCEEEYADRRRELGYEVCLDCGQTDALRISQARTYAKLCEMTPNASSSLDSPEALLDPRGKDYTNRGNPNR